MPSRVVERAHGKKDCGACSLALPRFFENILSRIELLKMVGVFGFWPIFSSF
jgi:hypothetical protein